MRFFLRVALILGGVAALLAVGDRRLKVAIARLDAEEPGWRFEDLEAARRAPTAERNLALVVLAAERLPAERDEWRRSAEWFSLEPVNYLPKPNELKAFREHAPPTAPAHAHSLTLRDYPSEYYLLAFPENPLAFIMPRMDQLGRVAAVLEYDAVPAAVDSDPNRAIRPAHAILNAGRSIGDEPLSISQLARAGCDRQAVRALEQTVALGEVSAKSLEQLQRLLAEEAEAPVALIGVRAGRVAVYQCLDAMRTGHFSGASYGMKPSFLGSRGDDLLDRGRARACQAAYLRYYNEVVEAVKLPTEVQQEALDNLREPKVQLPKLLEALTQGGECPRMVKAFHQTKAELRCAAAALAAERYRLAQGHWPKSLDDLVPDYLPAVPADPFDGKPLRLEHLPDGLVIYSTGPDRTDDGGNIDRSHPGQPGTDVGFQLWDPDRRGKK